MSLEKQPCSQFCDIDFQVNPMGFWVQMKPLKCNAMKDFQALFDLFYKDLVFSF